MNIYICNLRSTIGNDEVKELFSPFGEVKSAEIVNDGFTGQSRGFAYVEMENEEEAKKAIEALNKTEVQELTITVEEAPLKKEHKGSYKVGNSSVPGYRFRKY
jgi:RNA recognition motif-containing protein